MADGDSTDFHLPLRFRGCFLHGGMSETVPLQGNHRILTNFVCPLGELDSSNQVLLLQKTYFRYLIVVFIGQGLVTSFLVEHAERLAGPGSEIFQAEFDRTWIFTVFNQKQKNQSDLLPRFLLKPDEMQGTSKSV